MTALEKTAAPEKMIQVDMNKVAEIIRHVSAVEVMPMFRNLQQGDIREKHPGDFVTVADEASEKLFTQLLQELLPDSVVVGEEAVAKDITVLEKLKGDLPVWVIDPIDGTYNFAHGHEQFGILIALVHRGVTLYGWAFDAPANRMAMGSKGGGTFIDGVPVHITCDAQNLLELTGQCGGLHHSYPQAAAVATQFKEMIHLRCSLHDFMNFLTGVSNFVVHANKTTPWDHAAVCLLAAEAGAYVATNHGDAFDPTHHGRNFLIAAPSKAWWDKLHTVFYPLFGEK